MHRSEIRLISFASVSKFAIVARATLALFSILVSIAFAWLVMGKSYSAARGTSPTIIETYLPTKEAWGVTIHNGNVWVADPQCDVDVSAWPLCTRTRGNILEYSAQGFDSNAQPLHNFTEPADFSSPFFLAFDANGNIWFAEPVTNAIGELNPGTGQWSQYPVPTQKASPFDLTFDQYGHLWFTELSVDQIGEFDPTTQQFNETPTPTRGSNPYGIAGPDPTSGSIWFTENSSSVHRIGSFKPTSSGSMENGIQEYLTNSSSKNGITPHLITFDHQGNIWWSEGYDGEIGQLVINKASPGTSNGVSEFAVPRPNCPNPPGSCGSHISGIAVDSSGTVWFDDSLSSRIGSFTPGPDTFSMTVIDGSVTSNAHPHDGLAIDSNDNIWFTEEFANKLAEAIPGSGPNPTPTTPTATPSPRPSPSPTLTPSPTSTGTPSPATSAPVSKQWYFAEGKVGGGFTEYITLENPDPTTACTVDIQYLLGNGQPVTKIVPVNAGSRFTESVDRDLGYLASNAANSNVSTLVTIDPSTPNCKGVVAERPMYFTNFFGVSSGDDVVGATHLEQNFYFADISTLPAYNSYITILNPPGGSSAMVTATYYARGQQVGRQTLTVQPGTRGTITPTRLNERVAAQVTSDQPVVVERPTYFSNYSAGNAGTLSGAGSVIGATSSSSDWRFAEGYVGPGFQEDLVMANFDQATDITNGTLLLEYDTGATYSFPISIPHYSQASYDINQLTTNPSAFGGGCISQTCTLSRNVSMEVTIPPGSPGVVAEREMYFHYNNNHGLAVTGGTDVTGQSGTASYIAYSFAEGYTNTGFNEWLTLQNPTTSDETIWVTLFNQLGRTFSKSYSVPHRSRFTIDVTSLVAQILQPGTNIPGNEVSMTVQTLTPGAYFVAERPEYFSAFGTGGGSDVIGYSG